MLRDEDRLAAVVARAIDIATAPLLARIEALERQGVPRDGRDGLPGVPGPPGEKGLDGKDGKDGLDGLHGKDGLGWQDFEWEHDADGRLWATYQRGDVVKRALVPGHVYRGLFTEGTEYRRGDSVTWGGGQWMALDTTDGSVKPDQHTTDGKRVWQLSVMRGKQGEKGLRGEKGADGINGRDGRDLNQRW